MSNPVPFSDVAVVVNEQPVAVLPMRGWLGDLKGYGFDSSTYMIYFLCAAPNDWAVYPFLNYLTPAFLVADYGRVVKYGTKVEVTSDKNESGDVMLIR